MPLAVAVLTFSASAAPRQSEFKVISGNVPLQTELKISGPEKSQAESVQIITGFTKKEEFKNVTRSKAPAKAPAAAELEGVWSCTYQGLLSSNSGLHEGDAIFTWDATYQEFEIEFPDNTTGIPLFASYNETTGVLTFTRQTLAYANAQQTLFVAQWPMNGTTATTSVRATYDASKGAFVFASNVSLALAQTTSTNATTANGYYWAGYQFTLDRPDGDYALKIEFDKECTPDNQFNYTITKGADISSIYAVALDGDNDPQDYVDYYGETFGKQFGTQVTPGSYKISPESTMDETGYFTVMLFGYNSEGALKKKTQGVVFVILDEDADFQTIGTIPFDDQLVSDYYSNFTNTKDAIEIQEHKTKPGVYRLVEPYAGQTAHHDANCKHYVYLDTQDPEFTNILASATGLDFGDGLLVIGTAGGALGYTKSQCTTNGMAVGTREDRKITFPVRSVFAHESLYNSPGSWSYMNPNNVMTIELPELVLNVTLVNETSQKPVEGVEISAEGVTATTDADGKATLSLPATVDYLQEVSVSVAGEEAAHTVQLAGAENNVKFETALGAEEETWEPTETDYVVYYNGGVGSGLTPEYWFNTASTFEAANPTGAEGKVWEFKAGNLQYDWGMAGYENASMGLNLTNVYNAGILADATLNFDWYATTSTKYTVRITAVEEEDYDFTPTADQLNQWNTTSLKISEIFPKVVEEWKGNITDGKGYVFSIIMSGGSEESVMYLNKVYYSNVDYSFEPPVVEFDGPTTVPVPAQEASDVVSIFSSKYEDAATIGIGGWGQKTIQEVKTIDGSKVAFLRNFNYQGWEFTPAINASECNYLHVDMWTSAENVNFGFTPISPANGANANREKSYVVSEVKTGEWNSYDVPLTYFTDGMEYPVEFDNIFQFKFDQGTEYSCYIANVYFYKSESGEEPEQPEQPTTGGTYTGQISGVAEQDMNDGEGVKTYDYDLNYSITYNEDKTLTLVGSFTWKNGEPVGATDGLSVGQTGIWVINSTQGTEIKTEKTFEAGQTVDIYFSSGYALGVASETVTYVVGSSNTSGEEPETVEGNMTAQADMNMGMGDEVELGDVQDWEVTATYSADTKQLTIYNFGGNDPITFTVNVENNTIAAAAGQVAFDESDDEGFTYYYYDIASEEQGANGRIYTTGEQTTLYVNPWGAGAEIEGWGLFYPVAMHNTVVVLDMTIEGLAAEPTIEITNLALAEDEANGQNRIITITYETSNLPEGAKVFAEVTCETEGVEDEMNVLQELHGSPAEVKIENAVAADGHAHTYKVVLTVKDAEENTIATATNTIVSTGVEGIEADNQGAVRYYNLQGVEVAEPSNGVFIKVEGAKKTKVLVK